MNKTKKITVKLTEELSSWLDKKADNGYKKASLTRHLLQKQMEFEKGQRAASSVVVQ